MTVQITKNANNMTDGINNMTDAMIEDYNDFISTERMQDTFANGFEIRKGKKYINCLLYTSPSPRDPKISRMPSSA